MNPQTQFMLTALLLFLLWRVYDALRARRQTKMVSLLWHSVSFLFMLASTLFVYNHFFGLQQFYWRPVSIIAVASWWLADFTYNLINRLPLFYPGDGEGSTMEVVVKWISAKINKNTYFTLAIAKLLATTVVTLLLLFV